MKIMVESATGCSFILCPLALQMGTLERELWQFRAAVTRSVSWWGKF